MLVEKSEGERGGGGGKAWRVFITMVTWVWQEVKVQQQTQ